MSAKAQQHAPAEEDPAQPEEDLLMILVGRRCSGKKMHLHTDRFSAYSDRRSQLANEHNTVRQMLGHGGWTDAKQYKLQTLT